MWLQFSSEDLVHSEIMHCSCNYLKTNIFWNHYWVFMNFTFLKQTYCRVIISYICSSCLLFFFNIKWLNTCYSKQVHHIKYFINLIRYIMGIVSILTCELVISFTFYSALTLTCCTIGTHPTRITGTQSIRVLASFAVRRTNIRTVCAVVACITSWSRIYDTDISKKI